MDLDFWDVVVQIVGGIVLGELTYQMWELWKMYRNK